MVQVCQISDESDTLNELTKTWVETYVKCLAALVQSMTRRPRSRTTDHCYHTEHQNNVTNLYKIWHNSTYTDANFTHYITSLKK